LDLSSRPLEDLLDDLAAAAAQLTVHTASLTLTGTRVAAWNRLTGMLVCRGGNGYTDDDVHFLRAESIQGITYRLPAAKPDTDRLGVENRESVRQAAGYPVSLVLRPNTFAENDDALQEWIENIVEALTGLLDPQREALQASIDQILLREGEFPAIVGGATLFLEAMPDRIPPAEQIRTAIVTLL
jgi:hypothetical protein